MDVDPGGAGWDRYPQNGAEGTPILKHLTLHPYYIHVHQLKNVDHVKYLSINIASDLRWDKHVDIICNKANSALGFIRRNVNIGNAKVKALAFNVLEYSSTVWDPYTVSPTRKLESVQRRAARYTLGRYRRTFSVDAMLTQLEWEPLVARRRTARLLMFVKSIMAIASYPYTVASEITPFSYPNSELTDLSHSNILALIFYPRTTVRDWNSSWGYCYGNFFWKF